MHRHHILLMDLAPQSWSLENDITLLQQCMPDEEIAVQSATCRLPDLESNPDLVLLRPSASMPVPHMLNSLRKQWGVTPILGLFSADHNVLDEVLISLRSGLDDFLICPFRRIDLVARIRRLLERKEKPTQPNVTGRRFRHDSLVGESDSFVREVEKIPLIAGSDATVLISGETGTGKELFARAIHYHSLRKGKPFIPVNCGALPDQLFENELFGHAKGAFTNAFSSQLGLVAEAQGGTLFLDEIDSLSVCAQTKLLRFLQDRQYRPLGSAKSVTADVRIIAGTNADLRQKLDGKHFREDLYYRLNIVSLPIPPLRERIQDILLLATHFLNRYGHANRRTPIDLSSSAVQKLLVYPWPGNVRELEGVIQRAVLLTSSSVLQPNDLDISIANQTQESETESLRQAKTYAVREFERAYLTKLLVASRGNVTRAAKAAGKERRTFQRLLQKHNLARRTFTEL